ncbi:MAG: DUF721 domain-containing protein [Spirochaetes bacterium]|nr:DUF721 domain-containing protein [Spirochaetota bacterium]
MGKWDEFQKAGDILKELFSHLNFEKGQTYVSFFSDWVDLVGVDLACHIRPVDIRHTSLLLEVDHPGWMQMFQLKQKKILHRIQKKHPSLGITSVQFRLKPTIDEPPKKRSSVPSSQQQVTRQTSPESSNQKLDSTKRELRIENERLRIALEKLETQIRKRSKDAG